MREINKLTPASGFAFGIAIDEASLVLFVLGLPIRTLRWAGQGRVVT